MSPSPRQKIAQAWCHWHYFPASLATFKCSISNNLVMYFMLCTALIHTHACLYPCLYPLYSNHAPKHAELAPNNLAYILLHLHEGHWLGGCHGWLSGFLRWPGTTPSILGMTSLARISTTRSPKCRPISCKCTPRTEASAFGTALALPCPTTLHAVQRTLTSALQKLCEHCLHKNDA